MKPSERKPNYFYTLIGIAAILFLLGFFALLVLQGQQLIRLSKEQVEIIVELKNDRPAALTEQLQQQLSNSPFTKPGSVSFIDREAGAKLMREEFGDAFIALDMPNPLYDVLLFNVRADYMHPDSLSAIRAELREVAAVSDVYYQESLLANVADNVKKWSWLSILFGVFLLGIAFLLMHNTIRLALYANRFIIKNMELVGASWEFISRPYLWRSIWNGLLSALLAIFFLVVVLVGAEQYLPELEIVQNWFAYIIVFLGLIFLGITVSLLSTWYTVKKYLKMRVDDLY